MQGGLDDRRSVLHFVGIVGGDIEDGDLLVPEVLYFCLSEIRGWLVSAITLGWLG